LNQKTLFLKRKYIIENNHSRILLRPIKISDVTTDYVKWLNSKKVNQFLESRFQHHTIQTLKNFLKKINQDENTFFYAIILKNNGKHIGNIKLGPINLKHKIGEIGIMIGDKKSWGQGYATEAINLLSNFSKNKLNLHKITAGSYANNIGSIKAFKNAGFFQEGIRKHHFKFKGKYVDVILLAKIH